MGDKHLKEVDQSRRLKTCAEGCAAAFSPDVVLRVGSEQIPANQKILMAKSPVFDAMLSGRTPMQEALSGHVELPTANAATVRALLSLLHTDGECLRALKLKPDEILNMLSQ